MPKRKKQSRSRRRQNRSRRRKKPPMRCIKRFSRLSHAAAGCPVRTVAVPHKGLGGLLMNRVVRFLSIAVISSTMVMAQIPQVSNLTTDILGAHGGYGRGCIMCHAPHSGALGNGVATKDATSGNQALWGQDLTPLYGQALTFGDNGTYAVTLPA